jgi:hypothetical protein
MSLDQRLTRAVRDIADRVSVPDVDPDEVRARARTHRRRVISAAVTAAVVAVTVAGTALVAGRDTNPPASPSDTVPPSDAQSPSASTLPPIETRPWSAYRSDRYKFTIAHPPNWTAVPATRDWTWKTDAGDRVSPAHEAFRSPDERVRVSAWFAPLDPTKRKESIAYLVAWVEDYCEETGNSPCTGIADRAVDLCLEKWDCHPGLLVPFDNDVQAFFSGGIYDQEAMTIVAVWQGESAPTMAPYGGAQRLLEAFLSTMSVWPSTTPPRERRDTVAEPEE